MKYLLCSALFTFSMAAQAQTRKDIIGCWTIPALREEYLSLMQKVVFLQ
jgi:hypothetical protein